MARKKRAAAVLGEGLRRGAGEDPDFDEDETVPRVVLQEGYGREQVSVSWAGIAQATCIFQLGSGCAWRAS